MTPLRHLTRLLGTLLALGLILLVSLFVVRSLAGLGTQPGASPPENAGQATTVAGATNTALGQEGAKPAATTLNPPTELSPTGKRPPACTFPLADIQPVESQPKTYIFSEPQIVIANKNALRIAGWLPDNETLLITRRLPESVLESIETFNIRNAKTKEYAVYDGSDLPIWLEGLQATAYLTRLMNSQKTFEAGSYELWLSYGSTETQKLISANASLHSVALHGDRLWFLSSTENVYPEVWDIDSQKILAKTIDLQPWLYSRFDNLSPLFWNTLQVSPQPTGELVAFWGNAILLLTKNNGGQICEVDTGQDEGGLPRWATDLRWSSDGRYLAMILVSGYPNEIKPYSSQIMVMDIYTGIQYFPKIATSSVYEIAWVPDSQILSALINIQTSGGRPFMGLMLLDVVEKNSWQPLPEQIFGGGPPKLMSWSTNGEKLAIKCPVWADTAPLIIEDRICVIDIIQKP